MLDPEARLVCGVEAALDVLAVDLCDPIELLTQSPALTFLQMCILC